ncbi:tetratricopeptide repeat protein [Comamonas sp. MYb396]|uniref:tetratricopeptide repeat protein n=1 Tax=Comamonas sp. MYb396 TaxID=2745302 RepID=UPI0030D868D4
MEEFQIPRCCLEHLKISKEFMPFVPALCPSCSGKLQVPDDHDIVKCMYCGVDVVVRQAIRLISGSASTFMELAHVALAARNFSEAYGYYTKVLEIEPRNADAWYGKGKAAGAMGNGSFQHLKEMQVAIAQAIKLSPPDKVADMKAAAARDMASVGATNYQMASSIIARLVAANGAWASHLTLCREIISLLETAHSYNPKDTQILKNIVQICSDNISGIKFKDPANGNATTVKHLNDDYEKELRVIFNLYAEKLVALEPGYQLPYPKRKSSYCFVITATMGSAQHPNVTFLRSFRDTMLVRTAFGKAFIRWYYRHGPAIARLIEGSRLARSTSYVFIVLPAVAIAKLITWAAAGRSR